MGCGSSKPERPQVVYLRDLRQPYKYPQTQHPPARNPPMEYAPQEPRRQEGPRLPVNSRSQVDSRSQPESSHRTNPRSQANPSSRVGRRPAANPWPQGCCNVATGWEGYLANGAPSAPYMGKTDKERLATGFWNRIESNQATDCNKGNSIPNRFETAYTVPRSNRNAAHARRVEITIPQRAATQHRSMQAQVADPLPEVAEVKARLSGYWDPMAKYGPSSTTDNEKAYQRTRRLSGPFGDMPDAMPASRTPSPPRPKRAKGKGRQLRLDTQHHQQWVGGREEHGGQWSPDFLRIQAIEARLVDRGSDRRYQEEWNQGIRR